MPPTNVHGVAAQWPPILVFRRALAYTGKSRATLNRHIAAGTLPLYGRAGGPRGERTFLRDDLDRWLRGPDDASTLTAPAPAALRRRAGSTSTADALARIEAVGRGGRR